jgi:hypothetical protein
VALKRLRDARALAGELQLRLRRQLPLPEEAIRRLGVVALDALAGVGVGLEELAAQLERPAPVLRAQAVEGAAAGIEIPTSGSSSSPMWMIVPPKSTPASADCSGRRPPSMSRPTSCAWIVPNVGRPVAGSKPLTSSISNGSNSICPPKASYCSSQLSPRRGAPVTPPPRYA